MDNSQRRVALAEFLRIRRTRLSPTQVGLPEGVRRRTPGLRREEVAQLANVSTAWYTYLEQGRDIQVSKNVLVSIANALQLTPDEQIHLFVLANQPLPTHLLLQKKTVRPIFQQFLDTLNYIPAYLSGHYSNILAWNRAASVVFGDFATLPKKERNWLWLFFTNSTIAQYFVNREVHAQELLETFRERTSTYANDPCVIELIEALSQVSPEFQQAWSRYNVRRTYSNQREIQHPTVGRLVLETLTFHLNEDLNVRCCIYMPMDTDTAAKLHQLIEA